jgi:DNA polymerase-3 subunit gamma/tau
MTLLRMLAFRPAGTAAAGSGGAAEKPATASRAAAPAAPTKKSAKPAAAPDVAVWADPDWNKLVTSLDLKGAVRLLAINCAYLRRDGGTLSFSLDRKSESMLTRQRRDVLAAALSTHFGESLTVNIELENASIPEVETPVQEESRAESERYDAARAALESDPNVQTLQTMFGAELKTDSIEPITPSRSD